MNDHHRPCACGAELEDECPRCARTNPLGSMRVTNGVGTEGDLWDNGDGKDERPAASTADRSSHSDSLTRREGVGSW